MTKLTINFIKINVLIKFNVDPIKTVPSRVYTSKKLTDGRFGRPHVRRPTDITLSQKLTLSMLRRAKTLCYCWFWLKSTDNRNRICTIFKKELNALKKYLFEKNLKFMLKKAVSNIIEKLVEHGIHCLPCSYTKDIIDLSA